MQEMHVRSLIQEDALEKEMTTHSSILGTSLVAQTIKNVSAVQETWVQSMEEEMTTYSSILAWQIPWKEEPAGLQSRGLQRIKHN